MVGVFLVLALALAGKRAQHAAPLRWIVGIDIALFIVGALLAAPMRGLLILVLT
jgi:general stress protein CsbA